MSENTWLRRKVKIFSAISVRVYRDEDGTEQKGGQKD